MRGRRNRRRLRFTNPCPLLPKWLEEPAYPAEQAMRRMRGKGEINWAGKLILYATP